ncbi:plasmid pRiA4b ORF-3 family protein [Paraburkholderia hospita]|uniref:Plasmid pRiA4b ORF-3 family protein n=1 Tax=Paraburkholderia hospita TaxID=169430 RepID=A0AAN1JLX0_9BURK|nr:plasmid pRiA4b ORF-3 family protein [Paraburkholderia hospita]AUT76513.1 plasmid pRiA4b ORF-3 family protein [Paraburkholderia hospita]SEI22787.1 pRiA4b ORF-3-like protein [Paraburkholderia hospita]
MTEGRVYSGSMDSDSSEVTSVLQLRISLRGVNPPVWRRLLIPEEITIAQLHHVMQLAMGWNNEHLHRFIIRGWRYGGHRDGAFQFFDGPDTLSVAAFGLHEHERFAYLYDFTSWWLHDVRVERRTCNQRARRLPRCVESSGRCPPEDAGGAERYMNALEVHGEHEFLEWIETLREGQIAVNDLRVEDDEWLIWLDRRFDRRTANERLLTLAR